MKSGHLKSNSKCSTDNQTWPLPLPTWIAKALTNGKGSRWPREPQTPGGSLLPKNMPGGFFWVFNKPTFYDNQA